MQLPYQEKWRVTIFEFVPVYVWLVVAVMGLLVASVINAIWLRLASSWLRIGELGFENSFGTAVMSTFVFAALWTPMVLGGPEFVRTLTVRQAWFSFSPPPASSTFSPDPSSCMP